MARPGSRIVAQAPAGSGLALRGPDAACGPLRVARRLRPALVPPVGAGWQTGGMSEHEDWRVALNRIMDEHDAADRAARRKAEAAYRRTNPTPEADLDPQRQAGGAEPDPREVTERD